jgi:hypothetical protein
MNPKGAEGFVSGKVAVPFIGVYIKQSALEYIINYLFDGLEACERNPATDDFELGYEQALHDTMVDLLRCHMLANLPPSPTCGPNGPSGFLGEPLVSRASGASLVSPSVTGRIPGLLWGPRVPLRFAKAVKATQPWTFLFPNGVLGPLKLFSLRVRPETAHRFPMRSPVCGLFLPR